MRNKLNMNHILSICERDNEGYLIPFMKAQVAVNELCRYFLGDDWYDDSGATHPEQINTNIVAEIERNYKGVKLGWFKRRKIDTDYIWNICDSEGWEGCILSPPMKAQVAVDELCRYFLGDDWYDDTSAKHPEQINTNIVVEIERNYKGCKHKKTK